MALKVEKVDTWSGEIDDRPGGLAAILGPLVDAGADFTYVLARRQPDRPGTGVVFVGGIKGAKETRAARSVGLEKSDDIAKLRLETSDKPGVVHHVADTLAAAGLSLRGLTASVIGTRCVMLVSFDSPADRDKAIKLLRT